MNSNLSLNNSFVYNNLYNSNSTGNNISGGKNNMYAELDYAIGRVIYYVNSLEGCISNISKTILQKILGMGPIV